MTIVEIASETSNETVGVRGFLWEKLETPNKKAFVMN